MRLFSRHISLTPSNIRGTDSTFKLLMRRKYSRKDHDLLTTFIKRDINALSILLSGTYFLPTSPLFSGIFNILGDVCETFWVKTRKSLESAWFAFVCIMAAYFCHYYFRSIGLGLLCSRPFKLRERLHTLKRWK